MKTLIVLIGPPGSGKSTFCKIVIPHAFRISQDDQGKTGHFHEFTTALLNGKEDIVIDRMNFNKMQRDRYTVPARELGYKIDMVVFRIDKELCRSRIAKRQNHPTLQIDKADDVLNFFFKSFQEPSKEEYDTLQEVTYE